MKAHACLRTCVVQLHCQGGKQISQSTWYKHAAYWARVNAPNVPPFVPDGTFYNTLTVQSNVRSHEEFQRTTGGTPMQGWLANEYLDTLPPLAKKT